MVTRREDALACDRHDEIVLDDIDFYDEPVHTILTHLRKFDRGEEGPLSERELKGLALSVANIPRDFDNEMHSPALQRFVGTEVKNALQKLTGEDEPALWAAYEGASAIVGDDNGSFITQSCGPCDDQAEVENAARFIQERVISKMMQVLGLAGHEAPDYSFRLGD